MIQIEQMSPFPVQEDPFIHHLFHIGPYIGSNVLIMHENFSSEYCDYLIIVNKETSERIKVRFK